VFRLQSAVNILGEFFSLEYDNPQFTPLFDSHDIGFPLAYHVWSGLATVTDDGARYIEQTWNDFCSMYEVDPYNEFNTLDEFLSFYES
jgi:hypothetical protein